MRGLLLLIGFVTVSLGEPLAWLVDREQAHSTAQGWGISVIEPGETSVIVTNAAS